MARLDPQTSVLGKSTQITGRISGEGGLRIEGTVRGDVSVTGPLELADGAHLEGNVGAESLEVRGTLEGDAATRGPILILSGAVVRGELKGSEISIEEGSRVAVRLNTEFELNWTPTARR